MNFCKNFLNFATWQINHILELTNPLRCVYNADNEKHRETDEEEEYLAYVSPQRVPDGGNGTPYRQ